MADEVLLEEGVPFKIVDLGDGTFALKTSSGITGTVDVSDRAARDLGKVDVALLDQYTPVDVDSGAGASNAVPVALRVPGAGGVTIPGDATNGLDVDVTRVADGADVALGAVADAAVVTDAVGTISGKVRGLVSLLVSLLARLPAALGAGGGLKVDGSGTPLPVSGTITANQGTAGAAAWPVSAAPFAAILEGGTAELIGVNEQVDQNDYCGSVGVALGGTYSGEILNVTLISTEDGSGSVQTPDGVLYIFDANPNVASGDTAIAAAAWPTCIGKLAVAAADWTGDTNGKVAFKDVAIAFHAIATLYFVFINTAAAGINDAAGDDEQIEFNFWYRRDS